MLLLSKCHNHFPSKKKKQKRQAEALFTLIFRSLTIFFGIVKPA